MDHTGAGALLIPTLRKDQPRRSLLSPASSRNAPPQHKRKGQLGKEARSSRQFTTSLDKTPVRSCRVPGQSPAGRRTGPQGNGCIRAEFSSRPSLTAQGNEQLPLCGPGSHFLQATWDRGPHASPGHGAGRQAGVTHGELCEGGSWDFPALCRGAGGPFPLYHASKWQGGWLKKRTAPTFPCLHKHLLGTLPQGSAATGGGARGLQNTPPSAVTRRLSCSAPALTHPHAHAGRGILLSFRARPLPSGGEGRGGQPELGSLRPPQCSASIFQSLSKSCPPTRLASK